MAKEEKKSYGWIIFFVILTILVILFLVLATWQVPYVVKENYNEQVNTKNCDSVQGCSCLHKSWLGLGACDSCNCVRQKDITQYCSALNKLTGNC